MKVENGTWLEPLIEPGKVREALAELPEGGVFIALPSKFRNI